jgi:uncharacterized membrane protein
VFVLKAWIMTKTDGWWFGETLQGFVGWALVSFVIVFSFRQTLRKRPSRAALSVARRHTLAPLVIYGGNMVFQICEQAMAPEAAAREAVLAREAA